MSAQEAAKAAPGDVSQIMDREPRTARERQATGGPGGIAPPVLVLGVGNEALRDEGIGIHVARCLLSRDLPPHVRVIDGGTGGWGLVGLLEGVHRLVLVDAMDMGRRPGTVVAVRPQELRRTRPADRTSLHGTSVLDVLELAKALGLEPPETWIVGVQPAEVAWGLELTPELQQALPRAVEAVLRAIGWRPSPGSQPPIADS